jgi:hypothetical protein
MGDIRHRNNDEAVGVGRQCRLDTLLNVSGVKRFPWVPSRKSVSEKGSDPILQGHPTAKPISGLHQKSALAQPVNRIGRGAGSPAECDITQNSQIAHVEIHAPPTMWPKATRLT